MKPEDFMIKLMNEIGPENLVKFSIKKDHAEAIYRDKKGRLREVRIDNT